MAAWVGYIRQKTAWTELEVKAILPPKTSPTRISLVAFPDAKCARPQDFRT
jgi:hypothetical protein